MAEELDENEKTPSDEEVDRVVRRHGSVLEFRKHVRQTLKDDMEYEFKAITYLIGGHAAGLIGCLTFLKDYDPTKPLMHGIAIFVSMFSLGFVTATLALVAFLMARHELESSFDYDQPFPQAVMNLLRGLEGTSLIAMILAVVVITTKVWLL